MNRRVVFFGRKSYIDFMRKALGLRSKKRIIKIVLVISVVLILGFLAYDSKEPYIQPLFIKQVETNCPYYKDFLGRVFYKSTYVATSILIGFSSGKELHDWYRVKNINYNNFRIIKRLYSKDGKVICLGFDDKNLIYFNYVFNNADPETFQEVNPSYFKDIRTVWYSMGQAYSGTHAINVQEIPGADPNSFEILTGNCDHSPYSRDFKNVYYAERIISGADRNTFEIVCNEDFVTAKDKNHTYFGYEIKK